MSAINMYLRCYSGLSPASDRLGSCCLNNSEWVVSVYECVALCYVHKQQFAMAYACLPSRDVAKYKVLGRARKVEESVISKLDIERDRKLIAMNILAPCSFKKTAIWTKNSICANDINSNTEM